MAIVFSYQEIEPPRAGWRPAPTAKTRLYQHSRTMSPGDKEISAYVAGALRGIVQWY